MDIKRAPPSQCSSSLQKMGLKSFRCHTAFLGYMAGADLQLSPSTFVWSTHKPKLLDRNVQGARALGTCSPEEIGFQVVVGLSLEGRYLEGFGALGDYNVQ